MIGMGSLFDSGHVTPLEIHAARLQRAADVSRAVRCRRFTFGNWVRRGGLIALAMTTILTSACGGGGGGDSSASTANAGGGANAGANSAPTISATPATQASVGAAYTLAPQASDADGDTLAFSIQNKPDLGAVQHLHRPALRHAECAEHDRGHRDHASATARPARRCRRSRSLSGLRLRLQRRPLQRRFGA